MSGTPGWEEVLITSQVDGATITAAAATSMIPAAAKYPLPAGFFGSLGKQLRIVASGRASTVVTTPGTYLIDVRFGATVVFDGLAVALVTANAYTNVGWYLDILLTARLLGAAGNLMGQGILTAPNILGGANAAMPIGGVNAMLPWNTAPAVGSNFDMGVSQVVDVFFTQTVATGSWTCHQFALLTRNLPQ